MAGAYALRAANSSPVVVRTWRPGMLSSHQPFASTKACLLFQPSVLVAQWCPHFTTHKQQCSDNHHHHHYARDHCVHHEVRASDPSPRALCFEDVCVARRFAHPGALLGDRCCRQLSPQRGRAADCGVGATQLDLRTPCAAGQNLRSVHRSQRVFA